MSTGTKGYIANSTFIGFDAHKFIEVRESYLTINKSMFMQSAEIAITASLSYLWLDDIMVDLAVMKFFFKATTG